MAIKQPRLTSLLSIAFALLAGASAIVIGLSVGSAGSGEIDRRIGSTLSGQANGLRQALDRGMFERWRDILVAASLDTIRAPSPSPDARRLVLDRLQETLPDYAWIGIADLDGTVRVATNRVLEGADVSARPWFVNARAKPFAGDVHPALMLQGLLPSTGEPLRLLDIATPIQGKDGAVTGVLGAHLSWKWVRDTDRALRDGLDPAQRIDILILDGTGTVLLGPPALEGTRLPPSLAATFTEGSDIAAWPDGHRYLARASRTVGYRDYPGLGWTVVARQDGTTAEAPIERLHRLTLGAGLLSALLMCVLGAVAASRISRPLRILSKAAEDFRLGRGSAIPVVSGYREAANLADVTRDLVASLVGANERLEARVLERTRALAIAQTAAENGSRAKSEFLAGMSHELRTPLNAISGFAETIERDLASGGDTGAHGDHARDIRLSAGHLLDIINDILDFSKAEAGRLALHEEPVDLEEVTHSACRIIAGRAAAGQLTLVNKVPRGLPPILADERRMRQILINLLANAVKYTPPGGEIRLETDEEPDGRLVLRISDSGIGIAPDDMARVFEAFAQVDCAQNRRIQGTGLGLPLTRQLAELHGGSLHLGRRPGGGTVVSLHLPAVRILRAAQVAAA